MAATENAADGGQPTSPQAGALAPVSDKVLMEALKNPLKAKLFKELRRDEVEHQEKIAQGEHNRRMAAQRLTFRQRWMYTVLTVVLSLTTICAVCIGVWLLNKYAGAHIDITGSLLTYMIGIPSVLGITTGTALYHQAKKKDEEK